MDELAYFPADTEMHEQRLASGLSMRWYARGPAQGAPIVLCLHGFPELAVSWRAQFDGLGDRYRVVAPDMRGYGGTDAPTRVADYRPSLLVQDVCELIDALRAPQVHLVGHDWGGAVAWAVAQHAPARLRSLTVLNCPPIEMLQRELLLNPSQARRSWYMFFFQLPLLPERRLCKDPQGTMRAMFRGGALRREVFTDEALTPYVRQIEQRGLPGLNYYRAALRTPRWRLAPVEVPSRLIWGLGDPAFDRRLSEPARYRRFVRDFDRVVIEDAGHWVQQEAPEQVNRAIADHIRAHEPAPLPT
ncbi:alpha/beta fold hydrolase [Haliangium sp.]|uniref:alpha/beta fold hydrolase n=1 Tax=Haliangium sp. TaxID=2663208 RepID=UPI003D0D3007